MVGLWLRTELRRRWKAIVVLGVLAGLTGGLAMAAVDGARRSATVLQRVTVATKEPDVAVLPSRPNFNWKPIEKLPEVKALGLFGVTYVLGAEGQSIKMQPSGFPPVNQAMGRDVDVVRVDQGRAVNPHNPHEVIVTQAAVDFMHLRLGQSFTMTGPTMADLLAEFTGGTPTGKNQPHTRVKIVGISAHDSLWSRYLGSSGRSDDPSEIGLLMSPALVEHYHYGYLANALVVLKHGEADVAKFRRDVARVEHGDATIPVRDFSEDRVRFGRSITVEQTALLLFALVVTMAGLVLLGQALARLVQSSGADAQSLSSLGATRRQSIHAVAMPAVGVAVVGAVVAVAVAVGLSPRFPIGQARGIELDLGVHVDVPVLAVGALALLVAVAIGGLLGAWFIVTPRRQPAPHKLVGRVTTALHLPIPAELGTRMALQRGRGRNAVPVRPALVAAMAGVLGIVGAFTFRAGLDHAVGNVALAGTTWQKVVYLNFDETNLAKSPVMPNLHGVKDLQAAAQVIRTGVDVGGDTVSAWSFQPLVGHLRRVVTAGRLPRGPGEATLGVQTASHIGARVGSVVHANGVALRVVGIGFLPEEEGHSAYDQGMWLTRRGLDRVFAAGHSHDIDDEHVLAAFGGATIHVPPTLAETFGTDAHSTALAKAIGRHLTQEVETATIPSAVANLGSVAGLPVALGVFLVLLAVGALGHALVSSVSRRRMDLAVMRSIGVTPRQVRWMIAAHASVVGLVGLVVGVPLGLLVGRLSWRWVANSVPFLYVAPLALVAAAIAIPVALIVANLVAAAPGLKASRVHPAEILRAE